MSGYCCYYNERSAAVFLKIAKGQEHGAPAAKNMRELVWNDDLAADSAKVAGHCKMEHEIQ